MATPSPFRTAPRISPRRRSARRRPSRGGRNVLGLQFHPEADTQHGFERWLVGHAAEIAGAGIDPRLLRADARRLGPPLALAAAAMFGEWLDGVTA